MGVKGLWQLLDPTGKPVTLESLEGKILAVDVSIWLNQAIKGVRDRHGQNVQNAHLLSLYHRLCKLLYYRIRPVFVFDGGVPALKRQTLAARRLQKHSAEQSSSKAAEKVLHTVLKHHALSAVLDGKADIGVPRGLVASATTSASRKDDIFKLAPLPKGKSSDGVLLNSDETDFSWEARMEQRNEIFNLFDDFSRVDTDSEHFKAIPVELRYEILSEMEALKKETKWSKLHELPEKSDAFATYQISKLLKQSKVTRSLDGVKKELNTPHTTEVTNALEGSVRVKHEGLVDAESRKVVAEEESHYVLIRGRKNIEFARRERSKKREHKEVVDEKEIIEIESDDEDIVDALKRKLKREKEERAKNEGKEIKVKKEPVDDELYGLWNKDVTNEQENTARHEQPADEQASSRHDVANAGCSIEPDNYARPGCSKEPDNYTLADCEILYTEGNFGPCTIDYSTEGGFIKEEVMSSPESNVTNSEPAAEKASPTVNKIVQQGQIDYSDFLLDSDSDDLEEQAIQQSQVYTAISSKKGHNTSIHSGTTHDNERTTDRSNTDVCAQGGDDRSARLSSSGSDDNMDITDSQAVGDRTCTPVVNIADIHQIEAVAKSAQAKPETEADSGCEMGATATPPYAVHKPSCNIVDIADHRKQLLASLQSKIAAARKAIDDGQDNEENTDRIAQEREHSVEVQNEVPNITRTENLENITVKVEQRDHVFEAMEKQQAEVQTMKRPEDTNVAKSDGQEKMVGEEEVREKNHEAELSGDESDGGRNSPVEKPTSNLVTQFLEDREMSNEFTNMTQSDMEAMRQDLREEHRDLVSQQQQYERVAASITEAMYIEAQGLLELFGVPYVVSPMEAEAQCAELDMLDLTHGTITDDSDIWLFGGKRVYKNFFNQDKYVEYFYYKTIEEQLLLNRNAMVNVALLCGSDYTVGVSGVGPVSALEMLAEFPGEGIQPLIDIKKCSKSKKAATPVKKRLQKIQFSEGFPKPAVVEAYMKPEVDHSTEKFSWSDPDLTALRDFTYAKFGWDQDKTDETLMPMWKKYSSNRSQRTINTYFDTHAEHGKRHKSKRVMDVLNNLRGATTSETSNTQRSRPTSDVEGGSDEQDNNRRRSKRRSARPVNQGDDSDEGEEGEGEEATTKNKRGKRGEHVRKRGERTANRKQKAAKPSEPKKQVDAKVKNKLQEYSWAKPMTEEQFSSYFVPASSSKTDSGTKSSGLPVKSKTSATKSSINKKSAASRGRATKTSGTKRVASSKSGVASKRSGMGTAKLGVPRLIEEVPQEINLSESSSSDE